MTLGLRRRLWLVGDDEALDAIADLSRHLDYFQVARVDDLPRGPFTADDHFVIAALGPGRSESLRVAAAGDGAPGYVAVVPELPGKSVGARAIMAAAGLLTVL
jgi:hypothetical protein